MYTVLVISVIIVIVVLVLSVVTTSRAYQYKHTVDPVDSHDPGDREDMPSQTKHDSDEEK